MLYFSTFARCLDHEGILNIVTWMGLSVRCFSFILFAALAASQLLCFASCPGPRTAKNFTYW